MRFSYMLPASLLVAGSAFAQAGTQNAIGVWNSQNFPAVAAVIGNTPAGSTGASYYQTLPAELTTYFGQTTGYGAATSRTLRFRGYEMALTYFNTANPNYDGPKVEIRKTIVNPAATTRWRPDFTVGGLLASFASIPALIPGGAAGAGLEYRFSGSLVGPAAVVPAGGPGGEGVAMVYAEFGKQYGDANNGLAVLRTTGETGGLSYSGFVQFNGTFGLVNAAQELVWTMFFENAMIQPIKNSTSITGAGIILGGGASPATFTVAYNDGRGAINPVIGDTLSYNGNSRRGNPTEGLFGTTYFTPFVLYSGDLGPGDPVASLYGTGEVWNTGAIFVYGSPVRSWIDDFCVLSGACPAGTGIILNPANSSWGIWEGIDFLADSDPTLAFAPSLNFNVLLNGLAFADISGGPAWAGPATVAYDATAPLGVLGRNLVNTTGNGYAGAGGVPITGVHENRSMLIPQAGYTPAVVGLSFGTYPASPSLVGQYFAIQCWMLSTVTNTIDDMSNVAVIRL